MQHIENHETALSKRYAAFHLQSRLFVLYPNDIKKGNACTLPSFVSIPQNRLYYEHCDIPAVHHQPRSSGLPNAETALAPHPAALHIH